MGSSQRKVCKAHGTSEVYKSDSNVATQRSPLGSNWISNQIRLQFAQMNPTVPLVPYYQVKSKQQVDAGQPSVASYVQFATPPTDSFRRLQEERVLTSFKESMVQVWSGPGRLDATDPMGQHMNIEAARALPPRPFEMPDGWNQVFGIERFRVAEGLFDAKAALRDANTPAPDDKHTLPALVQAALSSVDADQRAALLNQVVLPGAGSMLHGPQVWRVDRRQRLGEFGNLPPDVDQQVGVRGARGEYCGQEVQVDDKTVARCGIKMLYDASSVPVVLYSL